MARRNAKKYFFIFFSVILVAIAAFVVHSWVNGPARRKFHIINLSLPKTGSTSIASIFRNYRSKHEGMHLETVSQILDWQEGIVDDKHLDIFLRERDELLEFPEVDSATFLHFVVARMQKLFPEAKFLICVRNGDEWIVSLVSMMLQYFGPRGLMSSKGYLPPGMFPHGYRREMRPEGIYIADLAQRYGKIFSPRFSVSAFRNIAKIKELVSPMLDDFAQFWGENTLRTLKETPVNRRLVLSTRELSHSIDRLAKFAEIPLASLEEKESHKNKDPNAQKIIELLGQDNIEKAVKPWQKKIDAAMSAIQM